jgi:hypothetical protein
VKVCSSPFAPQLSPSNISQFSAWAFTVNGDDFNGKYVWQKFDGTFANENAWVEPLKVKDCHNSAV